MLEILTVVSYCCLPPALHQLAERTLPHNEQTQGVKIPTTTYWLCIFIISALQMENLRLTKTDPKSHSQSVWYWGLDLVPWGCILSINAVQSQYLSLEQCFPVRLQENSGSIPDKIIGICFFSKNMRLCEGWAKGHKLAFLPNLTEFCCNFHAY